MKQNIILIGFMGSGKTTNGRRLAKKLNMKFIDTDDLIEENNNITITEIFKRYGEKYFRELEHKMIKELVDEHSSIISTGGGVIINPDNTKYLKQIGIVIYLRSTVDNICNNLRNSYKKRPLIQKKNWMDEVKSLMEKREAIYQNNADITIDVDNKKHNQIVNEICKVLNARY
ncbi:shikimate kinase [Clostridiaceae bacterium M8S5]|nr:shikimate kinase [Clostridiaceae bacterium M8S5]